MFSTSLFHFQSFQLFETDIRYIHFTMYTVSIHIFKDGFLFKEGMLDSGFLCLEVYKLYITSFSVGYLTLRCGRDGPKCITFCSFNCMQ
jgi:hypothetical protein